MATTPTCPKCNNSDFEAQVISPINATYKVNIVNCVYCGAIVGVFDYYNTAKLLEKIANHLQLDLFK